MYVSQEGIDDPEPTVCSCQMPRYTQPTGSRTGAHTKSPSAAFSPGTGKAPAAESSADGRPFSCQEPLLSCLLWQLAKCDGKIPPLCPFSTTALMLTHLTGKVYCGLCPSCLKLEDRLDWDTLMAFQHRSAVKTGEEFSFPHTAGQPGSCHTPDPFPSLSRRCVILPQPGFPHQLDILLGGRQACNESVHFVLESALMDRHGCHID